MATAAGSRRKLQISHFFHERMLPARKRIKWITNVFINKIVQFCKSPWIYNETVVAIVKNRTNTYIVYGISVINGTKGQRV
jgi:hypothetical protein